MAKVTRLSDIPSRRIIPERWGGWRLDSKYLILALPEPRYEIDLEWCRTSVKVLDWIYQISAKTWASTEILAGLVRALDDVLHPQANLCSLGQERGPLTRDLIRELAHFAEINGAPMVTGEDS